MNFGCYSGCKPNVSKTKCIPLGALRTDTELLLDLQNSHGVNFIDHTYTALGIDFNDHSAIKDICEQNYNRKLKITDSLVKTWNKLSLTLLGKCQIIKSLLHLSWLLDR